MCVEADELQEFHGAFFAGLFGLLEAGAAQEGGPEAFLGPGVAADEDVLQDRHVGEQADVLEGAGDAGLGDQVGLGRQDRALVGDGALGGDVQAGEAVEEGGLAGAVGADEADDLAGVDGEVDGADGGEAAEAHGDVAALRVRGWVCLSSWWLRPRLGDGGRFVGESFVRVRRVGRSRGTRAGVAPVGDDALGAEAHQEDQRDAEARAATCPGGSTSFSGSR